MVPLRAAAAAACRVWVGTKPCPFGISVFDTLRRSNPPQPTHCQHYDRILLSLQEQEARLSLSPNMSTTRRDGIPMGRARACPSMGSTPCPTTAKSQASHTKPWVGLAVVGLLQSHQQQQQQHLLLTRRPAYMRSFPGAWVLPGGTVDARDLTLAHAVARKVHEETGLLGPTDRWKVQCLWESVYPTQVVDDSHTMQAHHVVVYLSATLPAAQDELELCCEEVDGAVWLSRQHVSELLHNSATNHKRSPTRLTLHTPTNQPETIPLLELVGIYPQQIPNKGGIYYGLAQGSLFAVQEFCKSTPEWQSATQ